MSRVRGMGYTYQQQTLPGWRNGPDLAESRDKGLSAGGGSAFGGIVPEADQQ